MWLERCFLTRGDHIKKTYIPTLIDFFIFFICFLIFRFEKMSYSGKYSFCPGAPSLTAMKYLKTYIPNRDFAPGERYRHYRNMEAKVNTTKPGCKTLGNKFKLCKER